MMAEQKKRIEKNTERFGYQPNNSDIQGYKPKSGQKPPPPQGGSGLQPKTDKPEK
jgi:hypothetical protein